jgi:hypothetical protein
MISPREPTAMDRSELDRLSDYIKGRSEGRDQSADGLPTRRVKEKKTHVELPDERQELAERSSKVGSKNAGKSADDIGGVGDERGLVLGGVLVLRDVVVSVRVELAERLLLEDLLGVVADSLEVYRRQRQKRIKVQRMLGEYTTRR